VTLGACPPSSPPWIPTWRTQSTGQLHALLLHEDADGCCAVVCVSGGVGAKPGAAVCSCVLMQRCVDPCAGCPRPHWVHWYVPLQRFVLALQRMRALASVSSPSPHTSPRWGEATAQARSCSHCLCACPRCVCPQWNLAYNRKDVRREIIRSGLDRVYATMDKHVDVAGVQRTVRGLCACRIPLPHPLGNMSSPRIPCPPSTLH
jgi:hypothetical protein